MTNEDPVRTIHVYHISGISETVLALPALQSLRSHYPRARITVITSKVGEQIINLGECADEILVLAVTPQGIDSLRTIRKRHADLVIDLTESAATRILHRLSPTFQRELAETGLASLTNGLMKMIEGESRLHLAHRYLKRLEPYGVRPIASEPQMTTDRKIDESVEKALQKRDLGSGMLLVGIYPGGAGRESGWSIERFATLAARICGSLGGKVVVFAGPGERSMAKSIVASLPPREAMLVATRRTEEFASYAARLGLLVTNLGGSAHVAAAVGCRVLALSVAAGPTPLDLESGTSGRTLLLRAPHPELIREDEVFEQACRLISGSRTEFFRKR